MLLTFNLMSQNVCCTAIHQTVSSLEYSLLLQLCTSAALGITDVTVENNKAVKE
jgi:hypothetical protein